MDIILGIDPGSRITGFGVIAIEGKTARYVVSGCIRMQKETVAERLLEIHQGVCEIIAQYQPTTCAIEEVFMHRNPNSAIKLGQARGVAIVAMASQGLVVAEYSARQVKQAVVGYGAADKSQVQHMVKTLLKLPGLPQADAADALAIALCHEHTRQSLQHIGAGVTKTVRRRLRCN